MDQPLPATADWKYRRDARMLHYDLVQFRQRAVAARLYRHVNDNRCGFHGLNGFFPDQNWRRPAGYQRGGNDDIGGGGALVYQFPLAALVIVRHFTSITA